MSATADTLTDLLIIGAGPTGLYAAFYAGLRGMSVRIVDSLDVPGGQLATLYPEKPIYDAPGFPEVLAKDLVAQLFRQAMYYRPTLCLGEQVQTLDFDPQSELYTVRTSRAAYATRAILIAGGIGAMEPRRLTAPGAREFEGRGVYYAVSDPQVFRDRQLLIVGGGDSAVDWANQLVSVTRHQTLIHRRDRFRAHPASVQQMYAGPTQVLTFHELKELRGDDHLREAVICDNRDHTQKTLSVDAVLVNIGYVNSLGPVAGWGLEISRGSIVVDAQMRTNRPRIYAAGDITTHPGKLKLIATAFGEAAIAVNFACHDLDPKTSVFPGHSTNLRR